MDSEGIMELFNTLEKLIGIFQFDYEIKTHTNFDTFYVTLLLRHKKLEFDRAFRAFSYITDDNFIQKTYNKLNVLLVELLPSEHDNEDLMQSWLILQETTTAIKNQYKEIKYTDNLKDADKEVDYIIKTMSEYGEDKIYTNPQMLYLKDVLHMKGMNSKNKPVSNWNMIAFE